MEQNRVWCICCKDVEKINISVKKKKKKTESDWIGDINFILKVLFEAIF